MGKEPLRLIDRLFSVVVLSLVGLAVLAAAGPALAQVLDALTGLVIAVGLLWLASYVVRSFWPR